ncbi:MAG TPA: hypothetical protein VMH86_16000 [Rhizomicrobium sp.]|nr:hypothetical protein [Rhizomicrobium sp.]
MTLRPTLLLAAVLLLSGCTIFGGPADRALRRTPSYRDGYQDGCAAANAAYSNLRKGPLSDNEQYKTDRIYRSGWANGYQTCRRSLTPGVQANEPGSEPIPDVSPGHQ